VGERTDVVFKNMLSSGALNERPSMDANCSVLVTAGCDEDDEELFQLDRAQLDIKHTVESRAAVKSSLRIFGSAANLDIDDDTHLECQLQRVQIASVDRAALEEIIGQQQWKPDVPKLRKLKYRSKPRGGFFNRFGERQAPSLLYEITT
jgi:hypothetical protein